MSAYTRQRKRDLTAPIRLPRGTVALVCLAVLVLAALPLAATAHPS